MFAYINQEQNFLASEAFFQKNVTFRFLKKSLCFPTFAETEKSERYIELSNYVYSYKRDNLALIPLLKSPENYFSQLYFSFLGQKYRNIQILQHARKNTPKYTHTHTHTPQNYIKKNYTFLNNNTFFLRIMSFILFLRCVYFFDFSATETFGTF